MVGMRRRGSLLLGFAAAAVIATAGAAQGSVTIGSSLVSPANESGPCSVPCTVTNQVLVSSSLAPGGLASPVNGTVKSWSFKAQAAGYSLGLRILRPASGNTFTAVGTSSTVMSTGGVQGPVATSLPIRAGDHIGLNASAGAIILCDCGSPNLALSWTSPPLADGDSREGSDVFNREVLVQASVEPTNNVTFGAVKRNTRSGSAKVAINVPNPGTLKYGGSRVSVAGPSSLVIGTAIQLTVKAKGKSKKKLDQKGKVKVALNVTFTPTGGTAATASTKVKLQKKLRPQRGNR
jgi:hypothetical protein